MGTNVVMNLPEPSSIDPARLVFIGGLHRSGTTALGRMLSTHAAMSGFEDTGAEEDEGQHLQSVYPVAQTYGGPGRFARKAAAHLIEPTAAEAVRARTNLMESWAPHWDLERPLLVEKSPPNLMMGRYLQAVFPGSSLVVIIRHPIVVALSTKKWTRRETLERLVRHWFIAHDTLLDDSDRLERVLVLRYEDLIAEPARELGAIGDFLGLDSRIDSGLLDTARSDRYVDMWESMRTSGPLDRVQRSRIIGRFGERIEEFGYSTTDLTHRSDWSFPKQS